MQTFVMQYLDYTHRDVGAFMGFNRAQEKLHYLFVEELMTVFLSAIEDYRTSTVIQHKILVFLR